LSLQTSGVPAAQTPAWQVSAPLQRFVSAQDVPLATGVVVQPVAGLQPSVVHTLPSLQTMGVPAVHTPAWQVSAPLQAFPSLHDVPLATTALPHTPAVQLSVVHGLLSLQSAATLHALQPAMGVCWQPLTELQESVVQAFPSLQLSAVPAAHVPFWQVSAPLQTLLSEHAVPFRTAVVVQPKAGLQLSVVHTFPSSQTSAAPAVHTPAWQVSGPLQTFPSEHGTPFSTVVATQPLAGLQLSVVQGLPSLQTSGVPALHVPPWQVSAPLHGLPSLHAVPLATTALVHTPAAHVSVVHGLLSLQSAATLHALQPAMGVCWQPLTPLHVSAVHAFPSSQLSAVPTAHVPL
jgi:hypothetical protein